MHENDKYPGVPERIQLMDENGTVHEHPTFSRYVKDVDGDTLREAYRLMYTTRRASAAGVLEAVAGAEAVASASAARCMVSRLRSLSVGFLGVLWESRTRGTKPVETLVRVRTREPTPCSRSLLRAGTTGTEPVGRSGSSATLGTSAAMRPKAPVFGAGSTAWRLACRSAWRACRSSSALVRRMAGRRAPHMPRGVSLVMVSRSIVSECPLSVFGRVNTTCQFLTRKEPSTAIRGRFFTF